MPTDFGRDVSCTTSLKPGRLVTGARLVGEAAFRRLSTPRGMLRGGEDEQNYGFDLAELIGSVRGPDDVASLPGRIRAELLKDERIQSTQITVTKMTAGPSTSYAVTINAVTSAGPFELKLAASAVSVDLVGLEAAA